MSFWLLHISVLMEGLIQLLIPANLSAQWAALCFALKSKFGSWICVLLASLTGRVIYCCFMNIDVLSTDYEAIVKLSDGFNGADLRNVCTEAGNSLTLHLDVLNLG